MDSSFIPDIGSSQIEAPTVTPLPPGPAQRGTEQTESFKDQVMNLLQDVNDKLNNSDQAVRDLAMGKTNDLSGVVTSVEEANLALEYTIAIRSKLLDAYNEVARISV